MYIITRKNINTDCTGDVYVTYSVLDTKDMVTESYTFEELVDITDTYNLNIVGLFGRTIVLIDENSEFYCNKSRSIQTAPYKNKLYFSHIKDRKMYFIMLSSSIGYFSSISAYYLSIDINDFSEFNKYLKSIDKQVLFDSNFTSLRVERSMNSSRYTSDIEHAKCKLVYGFEFEKKCEPKTYFHTIDKFLILGEFYIIGICEASNSYFNKVLKDSSNKYCKMYKSDDILAPVISYEDMRYVFNKKLDKVYYNNDNSFSLFSNKGKEYRWG